MGERTRQKYYHFACPQPIPLWVVIASIIGGVLAVGLGILLVLKIIIMVMERLEYHRFLKDARHVQWANGQNPLYEAPETRHGPNNVKYRPGQVKTSAAY